MSCGAHPTPPLHLPAPIATMPETLVAAIQRSVHLLPQQLQIRPIVGFLPSILLVRCHVLPIRSQVLWELHAHAQHVYKKGPTAAQSCDHMHRKCRL